MFGIKKFKKMVVEQLNKIICELNGKAKREDVIFKENYVGCETCGCLVKKEKAEKVQSMVNKTKELASFYGIQVRVVRVVIEDEKEIKTSYYCKHCYEKNTPKKKVNRKK